MQPAQSGMEHLKERMRAAWMAGDFGQIARHAEKRTEEFVNRLRITRGAKVLDVACGTGNVAIPAARAGAQVTGVDIAPNLLEQARQRAATEGLNAQFDEGDAEQLPYAGGQFDFVVSMFGAMFAPRPNRVSAELVRVCRPGGTVAMANWTPDSFPAKMFALGARFLPPPDGVPPPVLWGDEKTARERLANGTSEIRTVRQEIEMNYDSSPEEVAQMFRNYFGPTVVAFSKLNPRQQGEYAAALDELWREHNEGMNGRTMVRATYLEVVAARA